MCSGNASRWRVNHRAALNLVANSHRNRSADESAGAPPAATLAGKHRQGGMVRPLAAWVRSEDTGEDERLEVPAAIGSGNPEAK